MYAAIINKQEYKFSNLQETATFLYNKTRLLSQEGLLALKFDVFFIDETGLYKDLNKTETLTFNRYAQDLWTQAASQPEIEALKQYREEQEKLAKDQQEKEKTNVN